MSDTAPIQPPGGVQAIETGAGRYQVELRAGDLRFLADEPRQVGGLGSGPSPYELLDAALGACTAMTLRLYANQKGWPLARVQVNVSHERGKLGAPDSFVREIALEGALDATQRDRLMEIAQRCPVHQTLERGARIETRYVPGGLPLPPVVDDGHMDHMAEACRD